MKILQKTAMKSLIVVGKNKKLLGTLSDGDIRRGILSGIKYNANIMKCYCKTPFLLVKDRFSVNQVKKIMNDEKLYLSENARFIIVYFTDLSHAICRKFNRESPSLGRKIKVFI